MTQGSTDPLVFVGGIHGVGKTTLCRQVAQLVKMEHITAGALILSSAGSVEAAGGGNGGKAVPDIEANQDRLLEGLYSHSAQRCTIPTGTLLDGHFCLLGPSDQIADVPMAVFDALNPTVILLVEADAEGVRRRLFARDGDAASLETLCALAVRELAHAAVVASRLHVPLYRANGEADTESTARSVATKLLQHLVQRAP